MKLVCTIAVGNRILPNLSLKSRNKHVKSTLALCKHPKHESEYLMILFTAQNKTGTKYKVTDNVSCILTRFINEGKATIQLKQPSHDLYIIADAIQLKSFLHLLKRALERKLSSKELTLSSVSVTPVSQKNIAPKQMIIKNRSEIPIKGFPRTLESLHINEIKLCKIGIAILQLQKLRILDVSDNSLEYLPLELNKLSLEELNVSNNKLSKSTAQQWKWIGGVLVKTLRRLNLSNNNLEYVPAQLVYLEGLTALQLDNNKLKALPNGIGNLRKLRVLTISNNNLTQVPGNMKRLSLEKLDVSDNNFSSRFVLPVIPGLLAMCSLKEYAAKKVVEVKLPYCPETIPWTLVDYLNNAQYCVCGKGCFEVCIRHENILSLNSIADSCIISLDDHSYLPTTCYYCSLKCFRKSALRSIQF